MLGENDLWLVCGCVLSSCFSCFFASLFIVVFLFLCFVASSSLFSPLLCCVLLSFSPLRCFSAYLAVFCTAVLLLYFVVCFATFLLLFPQPAGKQQPLAHKQPVSNSRSCLLWATEELFTVWAFGEVLHLQTSSDWFAIRTVHQKAEQHHDKLIRDVCHLQNAANKPISYHLISYPYILMESCGSLITCARKQQNPTGEGGDNATVLALVQLLQPLS